MPARRGDERTGSSFLAAIVGGSVSDDESIDAADTHLHDEAPKVVDPPMQRRRLRKKTTDVAGIFGDQYSTRARRCACKCFERLYKCPKMPFKCP